MQKGGELAGSFDEACTLAAALRLILLPSYAVKCILNIEELNRENR
jgi:hypothetical protein